MQSHAFNQKNLEATLCRNLGGVSECDTIVINTNCRSVTICQMKKKGKQLHNVTVSMTRTYILTPLTLMFCYNHWNMLSVLKNCTGLVSVLFIRWICAGMMNCKVMEFHKALCLDRYFSLTRVSTWWLRRKKEHIFFFSPQSPSAYSCYIKKTMA